MVVDNWCCSTPRSRASISIGPGEGCRVRILGKVLMDCGPLIRVCDTGNDAKFVGGVYTCDAIPVSFHMRSFYCSRKVTYLGVD